MRLWYRRRSIHEGLKSLEELAAELGVPSIWAEFLILRAGQSFLVDENLDASQEMLVLAEGHLQKRIVPAWHWLRLWRQRIRILRKEGKFEEAQDMKDKFLARWAENPDAYQVRSLPVPLKPVPAASAKPIVVGAGLPGFYSPDVLERTSEGLLLPELYQAGSSSQDQGSLLVLKELGRLAEEDDS